MIKFAGIAIVSLAIVTLAWLTLWGTLALWYRLPLPDIVRMGISGLYAGLGLAVIKAMFGTRRLRAAGIFAVVFGALAIWWGTLAPPTEGNWTPKVSRQVTGHIEGDILTLQDVREFVWRTEEDFDPIWTNRTYDLGQLQTVDAFVSYWEGPHMAHLVVSFGFAEGPNLAWSIEVRSKDDSAFHPVPDFFKTHTVVYIASVEQDVVGLRSNVRGDDIQVFRLDMSPEIARELLEEFVHNATALAQQPEFFHSLTSNCTTVVFHKMREMGMDMPWDWRVILNGHFPEYLYDRGLLADHVTPSQLRELGRINARVKASGLNDGFSAAARQGVPLPGG